jgi:hypothetical protein
VAFSVDPEDKAGEMAAKHEASFPVGFGVDAVSISSGTGCFYEAGKGFLHATGFILDPDGTIVIGVYSTGPLGRLEAETCLTTIDWHQKQRN